jgi:hypothetical protein
LKPSCPAILAGAISRPGDIDYYKIQVKAGEDLSFLNGAMLIGSALQPVVTILDADLNVVANSVKTAAPNKSCSRSTSPKPARTTFASKIISAADAREISIASSWANFRWCC